MHYEVELFASNDHTQLEVDIQTWLRVKRPKQILNVSMVADGAEYTYCVMFLFEPRAKPLPRDRKKR